MPACLHHPAQPRPHPRPDFRGRIWPRLIPPHRHRDRLCCVVCAPPQRPGAMLRAAWHVAWSRSQRRCDRCTLGRACVTTGCAARVASRCLRVVRAHVALTAFVCSATACSACTRTTSGRMPSGTRTRGSPRRVRTPGSATRNMQRATCNAQHAADNMQLTTCNMQLTTCGIEQLATRKKAAWIVQLATCAIVGCNGQVSTDATQLSA